MRRLFSNAFSRRSEPTHEQAHLAVLGSSSSEMFDYVFGDNPRYHPFWASGWSARGLRSADAKTYIATLLNRLPASSNILLNFGCTDVLFNARFMANSRGTYDFATMLNEAADGILQTRDLIEGMGFANVFAIFPSPIIALPTAYWRERGTGRPLPDIMMGQMYFDLFRNLSGRMQTIDYFNDLSDGDSHFYMLKECFHRNAPNHHPDYIKIQDIIWSALEPIPGMPSRRAKPHERMYPHLRENIKTLMSENRPRKRTCR